MGFDAVNAAYDATAWMLMCTISFLAPWVVRTIRATSLHCAMVAMPRTIQISK
jgi:hypothetical protein